MDNTIMDKSPMSVPIGHSPPLVRRNNIKLVIVGDGAVGKTCMLVSYATNRFPTEHVPTVFDNYAVTVVANGEPYSLGLFDTAGQEEYDRLRILAYPGTDIFLLCYSCVHPASFSNITKWVEELSAHAPRAPIILVATQVDNRYDEQIIATLAKYRHKPVSTEQGRRLARTIGAYAFMECSALTQQGLKDVFDEAVMAVLDPKPDYKKVKPRRTLMQRLSCLSH